jgi:hypothetical protein
VEILIELVLEGVVWVVVEVIGELVAAGIDSAFQRRSTGPGTSTASTAEPEQAAEPRGAGCTAWLLPIVLVPAMFAIGWWFGDRRYGIDPDDTPTTLYTALALTALFLVLAAVRVLRARTQAEQVGAPTPSVGLQASSITDLVLPWRWSAARFLLFAGANAALATGVLVGFR